MIFWGILAVILGLAFKVRWISFAGAYLVLGVMLETGYARVSLKRLSYSRELLVPGEPAPARSPVKEAFVGDTLSLRIRVENRKPLPVLWLRCEDEVPGEEKIDLQMAQRHWKPGRAILPNHMYLRWFERVEREFEMKCLFRGYLTFGPASLTSSDPSGLKENTATVSGVDTLIVYPRVLRITVPYDRKEHPLGETPGRAWLQPDPLEIAGTKPYTPGTPLNQISWKATARTARLQAKHLLPTFRSQVVVALNLSTCEYSWEGVIEDSLESSVCLAASICVFLKSLGIQTGLASNAPGNVSDPYVYLPPGLSAAHFKRILRTLARVYVPWGEFSETLLYLERKLNPGAGVIAVMSHSEPADWEGLLRIRSLGHPVMAVVLGRDRKVSRYYASVPVWCPAGPVDWRSGESVELVRLRPVEEMEQPVFPSPAGSNRGQGG